MITHDRDFTSVYLLPRANFSLPPSNIRDIKYSCLNR